jgi:hypothetical protein
MSFEYCAGLMKPGDVIAFRGRGIVSGFAAAGTDVSHVGIIVGETLHGPMMLEVRWRVGIVSLRDKLEKYNGDAWWLQLHDSRLVDVDNLLRFADITTGWRQSVLKGFAATWNQVRGKPTPWRRLRSRSYTCAELVCEALHWARIHTMDPDTIIGAAAVCDLPIYAKHRVQIGGDNVGIGATDKAGDDD